MKRLTTIVVCLAAASLVPARAAVLDGQKLLDAQSFWDNRDWDWYRANIPFFECPDAEIATTYYYRWELVTKHLTYGSPNSGYSFTEFIDRPFWSGAYGAISCPAGHQLYEVRWLRDPQYARDYSRYWFRTPGAQPRRYSTWLADAVWAVHQVHPDRAFVVDLLPDLVANHEGWRAEHFVPEVGLYWQTGHDDGMEFNINSRQTQDLVRGAPGFRPTLNAYLYADALAIARAANLAGDAEAAERYRAEAASLKRLVHEKLWDARRQFFLHMFQRDEERDGHRVQALSRTHESGKFAGDPHGRELIGLVPWQFNLPDAGYEAGWKLLASREHFAAPFGPTTVERGDPLFYLSPTCCWWSGQSWPYATAQTLKALANLLQNYDQRAATKADYLALLATYARTHRKAGRPYIAEAAHPDTGSWEGHDGYNHSEHYFHSSYCDLVITGLVGLVPRDDDVLEVKPLAPDEWDYFALDEVPYRGHQVAVVWDKTGQRYGLGAGLHLVVDGKPLSSAPRLAPLSAKLPAAPQEPSPPGTAQRDGAPQEPSPSGRGQGEGAPPRGQRRTVNFAVNNDGTYYPRVSASYTAAGTSAGKLIDGNYWYHVSPPNRWTSEKSTADADWLVVDFGTPRPIHTVKLYVLDDTSESPDAPIAAPASYRLEHWTGSEWADVPGQQRAPPAPAGHRANVVRCDALSTSKLRVTLVHRPGRRSGLAEIEAWGEADLPVEPAAPPTENLAYNPGEWPFPRASASYTSRFDKVEQANDGRVNFSPTPANRWTSYESPSDSDWLQVDFGRPTEFRRVELAIFDDGGGVQAPEDYRVEYWTGAAWRAVENSTRTPERPTGGQFNEVHFAPVTGARLRIVFTHRARAKSGVSEVFVWNE